MQQRRDNKTPPKAQRVPVKTRKLPNGEVEVLRWATIPVKPPTSRAARFIGGPNGVIMIRPEGH